MFYHLTDTWTEERLLITPRVIRIDDQNEPRDKVPCVAVAPSILQCIIALGGWRDYPKVNIYATKHNAIPATWIFDYEITQEHRIYESAEFFKIGSLNLPYYTRIIPVRTYGIPDEDVMRHAKRDYIALLPYFS